MIIPEVDGSRINAQSKEKKLIIKITFVILLFLIDLTNNKFQM